MAREMIENSLYMVIATSNDNQPWAVPVFFAHDKKYHFYFVSGKETRHVQHIRANEKVAVTIFDSRSTPETVDGIYIEGKAKEVDMFDLPRVIGLVYRKRFPDLRELKKHAHQVYDFWGGKPRRFYEIIPLRIHKLDRENETEVDRRIEINIDDLCNLQ